MFKKLFIVGLVALFVVPNIFADRRKYVWTYQYGTIAPGVAEMEFYQTVKLNTIDKWEYRIEVETGLNERSDFAVYQIFSQKEGESFKWDAVQFRYRYKLAMPGEFFVDPLLYLEYKRKIELTAQNKVEAKLILTKEWDANNFSFVPVYEFFWAPGDPIHEPGLDIGLSHELSYKFSVGIESTTRYEIFKNDENEFKSYFGPTISYATGSMFYTFGYAWGVTDDGDDARARFLMGVEL